MDDSVKSDSGLEVSVSFGRFENDALSWEKWSSFSPNKYLEEVGTLSTPGSVAQKKAYFEAHYKRIAAKKAEELDQEKSEPAVIPNSDLSNNEEHIENSSVIVSEFLGLFNGERLVQEVAQKDCTPVLDEAKDDSARSSEVDEQVIDVNSLVEEIEDDVVDVKCESFTIKKEAKDELNVNVDDTDLNVGKDSASIGLEPPQKHHQNIVEKTPERKSERKNGTGQPIVSKRESSKPNARIIAQKVTPTKIERNNLSVTKKKNVISPAANPLQKSTPRIPKSTPVPTPLSSSTQSLKKKVNGSPQSQLSKSMSKSKNTSAVGESKRAAPTSLHMSLSLGPGNSLSSVSMNRKSLIMEQMGDKDIVRRAFKTFQTRTVESAADEKLTTKNVSSTPLKQKISSSNTTAKGNEGRRKDAEKKATQRSQIGARSNAPSSGTHKSSTLDKKSTKASSPTIGIRSDEKADKRKEFLKKLEAKSIAREAENAHRIAKSKVGIENGTRERPALSR